MYTYSKDYEILYQHILNKEKPICFIKDTSGLGEHICWIERNKYGIEWVRDQGAFGCVGDLLVKRSGDEKSAFIIQCETFDCRWLMPSVMSKEDPEEYKYNSWE